MTERQKAYQKYLQSEHWKQLGLEAFTRDEFKCRTCGSGNDLQGHHIRYRPDWYSGVVDDIKTLCESCHRAVHFPKQKKSKRKRKSKKLVIPDEIPHYWRAVYKRMAKMKERNYKPKPLAPYAPIPGEPF